MPGLDALIDTTYGPFPLACTRERAEAFAGAIGDDPARWGGDVHPMFANAALFAAAPAFLSDEAVVPLTRSLIHSEQSYEWHRTLPVGESIHVEGRVTSARARGSLHLVGFSVAATVAGDPWVTGTSLFLMSSEAAASAEDAGEPDRHARPEVDGPQPRLDMPAVGESVEPMACGASRADLELYAAASGDRNPIHLDHGAARAAGLEGVIVHGLLMAAWVGRLAGRYGLLSTMKVRFRNPLRPATAATAGGSVASAEHGRSELDLDLSTADTRLLTARVAVTR